LDRNPPEELMMKAINRNMKEPKNMVSGKAVFHIRIVPVINKDSMITVNRTKNRYFFILHPAVFE